MTVEKSALHILNTAILPGETKEVNLDVANLHTASPVKVPVIISRSKRKGPVVLFTAGIHGDEVNGIEIIRQLIAKGINQPKAGTIICIPVINIFGFINLKRDFPDGRDLNRVFPGSTHGSLASRVAYKLVHDIVPHADLIIDFHTGGSGRFNAPQLRYTQEQSELNELAEVFGAPFVLYSKNLTKSFRQTCTKLGKDMLLFEGGKSLHIDDVITNSGVNGVKRILKHLGMLKTVFKSSKPKKTCVFIEESRWQRAKYSGMFKAAIDIGVKVEKDDIIGNITDPYGKFNYFVRAKNTGFIINVNESPIVYQGDALFHVSTKIKL